MTNQNLEIISRKGVQARTGLSRSTIYAYMAAGKFPTPIKLGLRGVGWINSEISQWIDARLAQSRNGKEVHYEYQK
jgi:prophage regulatory protein